MSKKTSSPTPCCKARVILGDGKRLIECPKCKKVWDTYTQKGVVAFHEVAAAPAVTKMDCKSEQVDAEPLTDETDGSILTPCQ